MRYVVLLTCACLAAFFTWQHSTFSEPEKTVTATVSDTSYPLAQAESVTPVSETPQVIVTQRGITEERLTPILAGMTRVLDHLVDQQGQYSAVSAVRTTTEAETLHKQVDRLERQIFHLMDESSEDDSNLRETLTVSPTFENPSVNGDLLVEGRVGVGTDTPSWNFHIYDHDANLAVQAETGVINSKATIRAIGDTGLQTQITTFNSNNTSLRYGSIPTSGLSAFYGNGSNVLLDNAGSGDTFFSTGGLVRQVITNTGTIGIGTTTPTNLLTVDGTLGATTLCDQNGGNCAAVTALTSGTSPWSTSGGDIFYSNGNVAIGTSTVTDARLVVQELVPGENAAAFFNAAGQPMYRFNVNASGFPVFVMSDDTGSSVMHLRGTSTNGKSFISAGRNFGFYDSTPDAYLEISASGAADNIFLLSSDDDSDGDILTVLNSGNVGIGTSSPQTLLHLAASEANPTELLRLENSGGSDQSYLFFSRRGDPTRGLTIGHQYNLPNASYISAVGGESHSLTINAGINSSGDTGFLNLNRDGNNAALIRMGTTTIERDLYVDSNVGIGTTTPSARLTVDGSVQLASLTDGLLLADAAGNLSSVATSSLGLTEGLWSENGSDIFYSAGNVSIGTTTVEQRLFVDGNVRTNGWVSPYISDLNNIAFATLVPGETFLPFLIRGGGRMEFGPGGDYSRDVSLYRSSTSTLRVGGGSLVVDNEIGIGTTTPSSQLTVQASDGVSPLSIASSSGESLLVVTEEGYMGIGRSDPISPLYIQKAVTADFQPAGSLLTLRNTADSTGDYAGIMFQSNEGTGDQRRAAIIAGRDDNNGGGSAGYLGFITRGGSNEKMRIDTNGYVGIGTTTPTSQLTIQATAGVSPLSISSSTGQKQLYLSAAGALFVGIDAYENPTRQFTTVGSSSVSAGVKFRNSDTRGNSEIMVGHDARAAYLRFNGQDGNGAIDSVSQPNYASLFSSSAASGLNIASNGPLRLYSGGYDASDMRMLVDTNGNVGIGTTSPQSALSVVSSSNSNTATFAYPNGTGEVRIVGNSASVQNLLFGTIDSQRQGGLVYSNPNNSLSFRTNGTNDQMVIDSTGNVGIGTTTPTEALSVVGDAQLSGAGVRLLLEGINRTGYVEQGTNNLNLGVGSNRILSLGSNGNSYMINSDFSFGTTTNPQNAQLLVQTNGTNDILNLLETNGEEVFTVLESGNVGIGTTTPSAQMTVDSTVRFAGITGGTLETDALGNVTVSSDERLKDIEGAYTAGLEEILTLDPIIYNWNEDSGFDTNTQYAGFSAQNVEEFLPEAVGETADGYKTLSTRPVLAAVVNAVQEMWEAITGVESRMTVLEEENELLRERLEEVEEKLDIEAPQSNISTSHEQEEQVVQDEVENDESTAAETESSTATTTPAVAIESETSTSTIMVPEPEVIQAENDIDQSANTEEAMVSSTTEQVLDTPEEVEELDKQATESDTDIVPVTEVLTE